MAEELVYQEQAPPADLAGVIRCVWQLTGPAPGDIASAIQPIVPDGCPEVILNLADPFVQLDDSGQWARQPRAMIVGQQTGPAWVGPSGLTRIVGIRLTPWGAVRLLEAPVADFRDVFLPLSDVLKGGLEELADRLHGNPEDRWYSIVIRHLRDRIGPAGPESNLGERAVSLIGARKGRVTVKSLARGLHVGERHLERAMRNEVGVAPIVFARIMRVQAALQTMMISPDETLSSVAIGAGYYDQPHFSREFRRLVGCTPTQFLTGDFGMTRHFVTEADLQ